MAVHGVVEGRRIWQEVAEAYRPPNDPFALYAQDERIGTLHAATLAINFELGVNTLSLHNAWNVGDWFGPYPLRLPDAEWVETFPRMVTPEEAAEAVGYEVPASERNIQVGVGFGDDAPEWVRAYRAWLLGQVERYGSVVRRETRREEF
jgi:hypothetical protein